MIPDTNVQKKVRKILKKIESGRVSYKEIEFFEELFENQPSVIPEVMMVLNSVLQKGDTKSYNSVILIINKIAENNLELVEYSIKILVDCLQNREKEHHREGLLKIFEILLRINQKYPERMRIAVPGLLMCLENMSAIIREDAYFMLTRLAIKHHEFFRGRSKEMIRALNGLNLDERIYACRLIKKIAEKEHTILLDTYDYLEDLRLNHPDNILRSEAAYAIETLKDEPVHFEKSFPELADLINPNKEDLKNILEGMGLNHLIHN